MNMTRRGHLHALAGALSLAAGSRAVADDNPPKGAAQRGSAIESPSNDPIKPPSKQAPALTTSLLEARRLASGAIAMGGAWSRGRKSDVLVTGLRSSDASVAVEQGDQWHWGSITKSMTATLCGRLVEAGAIRWETTIGQVLDAPGAPVPQAYRAATLLHLLSHRAGLQANLVDAVNFSRRLVDAREERLKYARLALAQEPVGPVGAQTAYSNNGYVIAGVMLETLTGQSWEALIQSQVFAPLGLNQAGQGAPGSPGRLDQPVGHRVADGKRSPRPPGKGVDDNVAAFGPAGRVHMPMADMLAYLRAHRDRPSRFLGAKTWEALHTPHFGDDYALGWFKRKDGSLWHNGSNTLWYGEVMFDQKAGFACAACATDFAPETVAAVAAVLISARQAALA